MIDITGDHQFIEVFSDVRFDSGAGTNKLVISINAAHELLQMKSDLERMKDDLTKLRNAWQEEDKLRKSNPALKDLYDKYQVVFGLVKKAGKNDGADGGG